MIEYDRKYIIVLLSELDKVDFSEVIEDEFFRKNSNETKGILKWDYEGVPNFLQNLTYYEGPFTWEQIMVVLESPEWN